MIASAMMVALGFAVATVLALVLMPLASRRAARLATERLQDVLPLSLDEITAERDGLRAVSAVEQRRLEQKLERAAAASAAGDVQLGRRTAELGRAEQARDAERAERGALAEELERARQSLAEARSQHEEARRTGQAFADDLQATKRDHAAALKRCEELEALAEERRGTIAGLETRCAGLDMRLSDRDAEVARTKAEHQRVQAQLEEIARERDLARKEVLLVTTQRAMLRDDKAEFTRRLDEQSAKLQAKSTALSNAERALMTETAERKTTEAELADLKRRFDLLEARLIQAGGLAAQTLVDTDLDSLRASVTGIADHALHVLGHSRPTPDETATTAMSDGS